MHKRFAVNASREPGKSSNLYFSSGGNFFVAIVIVIAIVFSSTEYLNRMGIATIGLGWFSFGALQRNEYEYIIYISWLFQRKGIYTGEKQIDTLVEEKNFSTVVGSSSNPLNDFPSTNITEFIILAR